ncbi:DUF362 domain-containing protein [Halobacteria archaeon AArc-dxtr1]|nr:DUF362 domain-containing protein [Halobacteria archaeon AArc-dxtr1]
MSSQTPGRVRAERVGPTTGKSGDRRGWQPSLDARSATFEAAIETLLEPALGELREAEEIVVVPDAHYPYHPSSGMITDPAVVDAVLGHLDRETAASLSVAGSSDERIAFDRTAAHVDYTSVCDRRSAELRDLSTEPDAWAEVSIPDGEGGEDAIAITVPEALLEATVVVVPTLRPTRDGPVAGAMRALGRHVESEAESGRAAYAATQAAAPALALLDATTIFGGEPFAGDALLAGEPAGVDAVGADLLDRSSGADGALSAAFAGDGVSVRVEGGALAELSDDAPSGELPPADETHPAVSLAYGLYATVSGDAVPPQLAQETTTADETTAESEGSS